MSTFRLDDYEITVGRFRKFVAAYSRTMIPSGAGRNPHDPNDKGWDVDWNATLPADAAKLVAGVEYNPWELTWTHDASDHENLPMVVISWYEAYAFCAWDGGRLPTEAEWNYAAAGGDEQRQYPWSNPPSSLVLDPTYLSAPGGFDAGVAGPHDLLPPVGSRSPKGDGRWGQSDLAGSAREWTADSYADDYVTPCNDCARREPNSGWTLRPGQGDELTSSRDSYAGVPYRNGARCARDVP